MDSLDRTLYPNIWKLYKTLKESGTLPAFFRLTGIIPPSTNIIRLDDYRQKEAGKR